MATAVWDGTCLYTAEFVKKCYSLFDSMLGYFKYKQPFACSAFDGRGCAGLITMKYRFHGCSHGHELAAPGRPNEHLHPNNE